MRLKCIGESIRPRATSFSFGDKVTASYEDACTLAFSDGVEVYLMNPPKTIQPRIEDRSTYVFKNLNIRDGHIYFNANSALFKSYPIIIPEELIKRATDMLHPPSPLIHVSKVKSDMTSKYFSLCGKVVNVSDHV